MVGCLFEVLHVHASGFSFCADPKLDESGGEMQRMGPLNLTLQNCALSRTKLADNGIEAHMRRCNGMPFVYSKAEEFDISSSLGIEGNEHEEIEATIPLGTLLTAIPLTRSTHVSRGHDVDDFDDLLSSLEPVEQREATIMNLEDGVETSTPSTILLISNAFIEQCRESIKPVMTLI